MLHSDFRPIAQVILPTPDLGRQHYMHSFLAEAPSVPEGFEDYLPTVRQLLQAANITHGECHLTIDEKVIKAGMSQRRPGPHVDGCFIKAQRAWGHEGGNQGWQHNCNNIPGRMAVIVAASHPGCRAWRGEFDTTPKSDGDLSHIADQLGPGEVLASDFGYLLSPDCIHESMIVPVDTPRTFIRIALPL